MDPIVVTYFHMEAGADTCAVVLMAPLTGDFNDAISLGERGARKSGNVNV